jgi:hypothetical protein
VAVTRGGTTWQRLVGIFDSSGTLVASKWSTYAASTVVFPDMYPGMYTISVYSSSVTTLTPLPGSTLHKDFTLTAPGVQPNATYSYTGAYALN